MRRGWWGRAASRREIIGSIQVRVLVVDDSAFMRRAISQMLKSDPEIEVVGTGVNGREAVELVKEHRPDVLTLDIEMPEMDGLTALRTIMRECPTKVLMLSSLTTEGSHAALTALKYGAADFLAKDSSNFSLQITKIQEDLLTKVRALAKTRFVPGARRAAPRPGAAAGRMPAYRSGQFDLVCIGSSTGGPPVLETVLTSLPPSLSTPIVIAQHMPVVFTRSMADRLAKLCRLDVVHAEDRMVVRPRTVYIAPGALNTHIQRVGPGQLVLRVNDLPQGCLYRPSVNALLSSAAEHTGRRTLAVVLTGIGEDGLKGARELHAKGGTILAQSEETSVVYGMPRAVTEAGLVSGSLDPVQLSKTLRSLADERVAA